MRVRGRALALAGALAALFAFASVASAAKAPAATPQLKTTVVTVSMFEMGFKLSKSVVPHGKVIFKVKNNGVLPHDFSFGKRGKTPLLQPGQSATLTLKFLKKGKFSYICTVPGHAEGGMIGSLTVK